MSVPRVPPPSPGESEKPSKKPDTKRFHEEMSRVDKIKEIEPDEPKKRRTFQEEQEKVEKKPLYSTSSHPSQSQLQENLLPENYEEEEPLYLDEFEEEFDYETAMPDYAQKDLRSPVRLEKGEDETTGRIEKTSKKSLVESEKTGSGKLSGKPTPFMKKQIKGQLKKQPQGKAQKSSMEGKKPLKEKPFAYFTEQEKKLLSKEKQLLAKRKKIEEGEKEETSKSSHKVEKFAPPSTEALSPDIPKDILIEAAAQTAKASLFLPAEISPLFEKMIGTVLVMNTKNLASTEVLLTSPSFADSVFFGTKIVIDRYSTAPNAFNIRLVGSVPAVDLFNEHLDTLMEVFQKGDYDFHINRLSAEYESEKPLIKRKPSTKEKHDEEK